jgi:preprotein translocase subunit YajC
LNALLATTTNLLAQTTAPATTAPAANPPPAGFQQLMQWAPLILIGLVMYIVMFRGKQSEQKKRRDMLSQLKRGDEIQTIGGEIGKVVEVRDDRVLVKVDESNNTKIWYGRNAIHRVVEADKVETK